LPKIICDDRLVGQKLARHITTFLIVFANGLAFTSAILLQNIWMIMIAAGLVIFSLGLYYYLLKNKRRLQYPLVPPEGKPDMYFPRTDIPRPVIEDFRRIEEKRRKFAKVRRTVHKAMKPKKR